MTARKRTAKSAAQPAAGSARADVATGDAGNTPRRSERIERIERIDGAIRLVLAYHKLPEHRRADWVLAIEAEAASWAPSADPKFAAFLARLLPPQSNLSGEAP